MFTLDVDASECYAEWARKSPFCSLVHVFVQRSDADESAEMVDTDPRARSVPGEGEGGGALTFHVMTSSSTSMRRSNKISSSNNVFLTREARALAGVLAVTEAACLNSPVLSRQTAACFVFQYQEMSGIMKLVSGRKYNGLVCCGRFDFLSVAPSSAVLPPSDVQAKYCYKSVQQRLIRSRLVGFYVDITAQIRSSNLPFRYWP